MQRPWLALGLVVLALWAFGGLAGAADPSKQPPQQPTPQPYYPNSRPYYPPGPGPRLAPTAPQPSRPTTGGTTPPSTPTTGGTTPTNRTYYPYPYPYGYYPNYPYYSDPYYYPGPVVVPTDSLYGPEAVKRFMGVDGLMNNQGQGSTVRSSGVARPKGGEAGAGAKPPQASNKPDAATVAKRFIALGNAQFAKQRYFEAYERYKKAADADPSMGDPNFRQGFALIALGRYDLAAKAFKHGLEVDPKWPESGFVLNELYGEEATARATHLETLAKAAEESPDDGDLLFLLGLLLRCDGKTDRAATFFQRAAQLAPDAPHLKPFLAKSG